MRITVTKEHVAKGKRGKCRECPIALAITEAGYSCVTVYDSSYITAYPPGDTAPRLYAAVAAQGIDISLNETIEDFDLGHSEMPTFSFKLVENKPEEDE